MDTTLQPRIDAEKSKYDDEVELAAMNAPVLPPPPPPEKDPSEDWNLLYEDNSDDDSNNGMESDCRDGILVTGVKMWRKPPIHHPTLSNRVGYVASIATSINKYWRKLQLRVNTTGWRGGSPSGVIPLEEEEECSSTTSNECFRRFGCFRRSK